MHPKISPRRLLANGGLAVVLLATCGYAFFALSDDGQAAPQSRTGTVARGTLLATVSASGSVSSARTAELGFGSSGTVEAINVEVGDTVKKGQVLATLDDTAARDSVASAKAALDAASEGDTSTASGRSAYLSARAEYNSRLRALEGTTIKAPFAGTITTLNGTVGGPSGGSGGSSGGSAGTTSGQGATAGGGSGSGGAQGGGSGSSSGSASGFMTIADTDRLEITSSFTEADITKIKKGAPVTVTFDALPGESAAGRVTSIDQTPTTENNVVRYGVHVALTDSPDGIRLGQTSQVQVTVGQAQNVLYVPSAAVRTVGGRGTVVVVQDGAQVTKVVQTGLSGDQGTEIKSGLAEGERVVITAAADTGGGQGGGMRPGGGPPGGGGGRFGGGGGMGGRP